MITLDDQLDKDDDLDAEISPEERSLLDAANEDPENTALHRSELDNTDEDGELLNEAASGTDMTGRDLDVPGSDEDDDMEDIGEEDEQNNSWSQADTE